MSATTRLMTPAEVGKKYGVTADAVRAWIAAGLLTGVNVASPTATRARWRMSELDLAEFEARRAPQPPKAQRRRRHLRANQEWV
jgi:hypothetical protein